MGADCCMNKKDCSEVSYRLSRDSGVNNAIKRINPNINILFLLVLSPHPLSFNKPINQSIDRLVGRSIDQSLNLSLVTVF